MLLTKKNFHDYQKHAIVKALQKQQIYLALGLGLGKTIVTLTTMQDSKIKKALIVAPKRVALNVWEKEALKWEHTKDMTFSNLVGKSPKKRIELLNSGAQVTIINTELLVWLIGHLKPKQWPYDLVVFDEAHVFKDPSTSRFKKIKKFVPYFKRVMLLSATPASNSLLNIWSQIYLLDAGKRLMPAYSHFRAQYFIPDYNGYNWELREGADNQIHKAISDVMVSMSTEDYLSLPDLVLNDIMITLSPKARDIYDELEKEAILEFEKTEQTVTAVNAAVLNSRLIMLASGTLYDEDKETIVLHDDKLDVLKDTIESLQGEPTIVLYKYISDKKRILTALKNASCIEDDSAVDRWNNREIPVLLLNPQSASTGLNLQAGGNTFIEYTPSYSLQDTLQVYGRLHRQGQKNTVTVHRLLCENTMDTAVIDAIRDKKLGQQALLDAVRSRLNVGK